MKSIRTTTSMRRLIAPLAVGAGKERAIPGGRSGQVQLLRGSKPFRRVELSLMTDAMVELSAFLVSYGAVTHAALVACQHGDHQETGLEVTGAFGPSRFTMVLLPCGESAPLELAQPGRRIRASRRG